MGQTIVDDGSAKLTFTANSKGASHSYVNTDAGTGGTLTTNTDTAAVSQGNMTTGESNTVMDSMIDAINENGQKFEDEMVFLMTRTAQRNYIAYLKSLAGGVESGYSVLENGKKVLTYEGHEVVVMKDWDANIKNSFNSVYKHRILLTTKKNLIFATDGAQDDKAVETWYNQDAEMRRYRVKYRAAVTYVSTDLLVVAY